MKIGIDVRLWSETGVGRYLRNLIVELSKIDRKNEYFLLVMSYEKDLVEKRVKAPNFKIVTTDIKWHTLSEQISLAPLLHSLELDIMHFAYFSLPINYRKPYVMTIHDLIIHHFSTGKSSTKSIPVYFLKRFAYLFLTKKAAQNALSIITVSQATKKEIVNHLKVPDKKIVVTYLGVDPLINPTGKKIFDFPYILYVGNAYPHKNLINLIKAFQEAKLEGQRLVLVGKENFFYKRLKDQTDQNGWKDVVFFGEASEQELADLYKGAKAFVMPSLMEGFGLPPLEAMASDCFVIASDIPSLREVCQDGAVYFNPRDISDIADKIRFAFSNKSKDKYIKKGKERTRDFSWARMARETLKIYESSNSLRPGK